MRWKLRAAHYLIVPGTQWEYRETSQTGRPIRKMFNVPMYLNPDDGADLNYPELGAIIVCHEGQGEPRDIVFVGEPGPDMEPLDEEAEALSESLRPKWQHPIETLPTSGTYGDALMRHFEAAIQQAMKVSGDVPDQTSSLKAHIERLEARLMELETREAAPARRA